MFENGSLLRRRKRFKLHKPDKELLKNELQALASTMPPPSHQEGTSPTASTTTTTTTSTSIPSTTGSLSAANLQRLREDLLRWEMQERRMMIAPPTTNPPPPPPTTTNGFIDAQNDTTSNYYLLTNEARQRLSSGINVPDLNEINHSYDTNNLLQTNNWSFSGFNNSYMSHLPSYLQSSSNICTRLPPIDTGNNIISYRDHHYDDDIIKNNKIYKQSDIIYGNSTSPHLSPNYSDNEIISVDKTTPRTSPSIDTIIFKNNNQSHIKKAKKPFTIENIIAPDDELLSSSQKNNNQRDNNNIIINNGINKTSLLIPRPMYAGFPIISTGSSIHRSPYGTTTWGWRMWFL